MAGLALVSGLSGEAASASQGESGPIYNPDMPRAWAKIGEIAVRKANERLTLFCTGDSISAALMSTLVPRLKIEHGNGGNAGFLNGFNGWLDDGNGTAVYQSVAAHGGSGATLDADAFSKSPIGAYWKFGSGATKYWGVGATDGDTPLAYEHPKVFGAPANTTRFGIYYLRRSGGGTFKVQIARGTTLTLFDVPGLTAVDTNGTLGIQYAETSLASWSSGSTYSIGDWVIYNDKAYRCASATSAGQSPDTTPASWLEMASAFRLQITQTSGGDVYILGALIGAKRGVIGHCWGVGGLAMSNAVESARFAELAALVKPDIVVARYIDKPGDATLIDNSAYTPAQMATHAMGGIRTAFPATIVPVDTSPWGGDGNFTAEKPHFLWFGPHNVNYLYDGSTQAVAMKANALAAGDCYVDTIAMMGAWEKAWDYGLMGSGESKANSVHQRYIFDAALISAVLQATGLTSGTLVKPIADQRVDTIVAGPNTASTQAALGNSNRANRAKFGDATTNVSMGPADDALYTGTALKLFSSDGSLGCGMVWDDNSGAKFLSYMQSGTWNLLKQGQQPVMSYNGSQFFLGYMTPGGSPPLLYIGRRGTQLTGIRHGNVTLSAGTATVSDAQITSSANIVVTRRARGGTVGVTYEAIPAAGSFTITARDAADAVASSDTSQISYVVVEP